VRRSTHSAASAIHCGVCLHAPIDSLAPVHLAGISADRSEPGRGRRKQTALRFTLIKQSNDDVAYLGLHIALGLCA
jgi:hypothetical protein